MHTILQHSETKTVVEDDSATEIDEEIIELEETSFSEKAPEISTHGSLVEGQIVLVQRKSLHWPAKIVSVSSNRCEVMIFDKTRTIDSKQMKFIIPFSTDQAICEGRSSVWVKAWKEAKKEFETKNDLVE